jgi:hypothetical protein
MSPDEERQAVDKQFDYIARQLETIETRLSELPTKEEVARLRDLLESKKRKEWLWDTMKVWATWVAAILVGITMSWEALKRLAKALAEP